MCTHTRMHIYNELSVSAQNVNFSRLTGKDGDEWSKKDKLIVNLCSSTMLHSCFRRISKFTTWFNTLQHVALAFFFLWRKKCSQPASNFYKRRKFKKRRKFHMNFSYSNYFFDGCMCKYYMKKGNKKSRVIFWAHQAKFV